MARRNKKLIPLKTSDLYREALKDPKVARYFQGVYPVDMLPYSLMPRPSSIIVNLDPHNEPGSHWVAIHFPKNEYRFALFFDSYGRPPLDPRILAFLTRNSRNKWFNNPYRYQDELSSVCGWYALLFLKLVHRNYTFDQIHRLFKPNLGKLNDELLFYYLKKIK